MREGNAGSGNRKLAIISIIVIGVIYLYNLRKGDLTFTLKDAIFKAAIIGVGVWIVIEFIKDLLSNENTIIDYVILFAAVVVVMALALSFFKGALASDGILDIIFENSTFSTQMPTKKEFKYMIVVIILAVILHKRFANK